MKSTPINETKKLAEDLYVITETGSIHCYLMLGKEKALLFDVGYGYEDITPIIRSITGLPLMVAVSHGDPDHALGCGHFEEVYLHELDYGKLLRNDNPNMRRTALEYRYKKMPVMKELVSMEDFCSMNAHNMKPRFLRDHDIIDLGGKQLEVIHIPGHSYGHIALLDRNKRRLFSGDMITQHNIWYFSSSDEQAPFSLAVSSWKKIKDMEKEFDLIYSAHGQVPVDIRNVDDLLECFRGELEQNYINDSPFSSFIGNGYQHLYKSVNLIYSDARLGEFLGREITR